MPEEIKDGQEEQPLEEVQGEEQQPEEVSTSEKPTEDPQGVEGELPEDAKDRTKEQFEKLKEHNKQLKQENEKLKGTSQPIPSVLDFLSEPAPPVPQYVKDKYATPVAVPTALNQTQTQPQPTPQLVNEDGYVNADVLKSQLDQARIAREKAEDAERRAKESEYRIAKFEQDAETKALYRDYPELDPMSESFNKDAYDLVRNELTAQIVNSGKRDAIGAASKLSKYFRTTQPSNQKVVEQRQQVSASSKTSMRESGDSLDELKARNDDSAIAERLKRLGM